MRYLLSTESFLGIAQRIPSHPVKLWADKLSIHDDELYLSTITIGQAYGALAGCSPTNPHRATWASNIEHTIRAFELRDRTLDFTKRCATAWGDLKPLALDWKHPRTGVQETLPGIERQVVAQALADNPSLTLVDRTHPYHATLMVRGLSVVDPYNPSTS